MIISTVGIIPIALAIVNIIFNLSRMMRHEDKVGYVGGACGWTAALLFEASYYIEW